MERNRAAGVPPAAGSSPVQDEMDQLPVPVGKTTENNVALDIEETGSGMEPKDLSKDFDPLAVLLAGRRAAGIVRETPAPAVAATEDRQSRKYLCFRVAAEDYAINLMEIKEIIKPREITEVPNAPAFVPGIISLRGIIMPVFDLRSRLGFPMKPRSGKERIVIVKKSDGLCGLLVDEVFQVVTLDQQPIERPPAVLEGIDREFISGIGRHGDHMFILMDLEKVLDITLH